MASATYRDVIRSYGRTVETGHADVDLNPRQRRLVVVMLNLASNDAFEPYPDPKAGDAAAARLAAIAWQSRALVDAVSPASSDAFSVALERSTTILHSL